MFINTKNKRYRKIPAFGKYRYFLSLYLKKKIQTVSDMMYNKL